MNDGLISRAAAIDILDAYQVMVENGEENPYAWARLRMSELPSVQPEITDEQAIGHLQASGWMQNHDKQMYEMGLKERLADDSDSYDALLPSSQPETNCTMLSAEKPSGIWLPHGHMIWQSGRMWNWR